MRSNNGNSPSGAQLEVRAAFKSCIKCYNNSPRTGGVVPPDIGYRSRAWWFNAAAGSGLWYYDYFISQTWPYFYGGITPDWCGEEINCDHGESAIFKQSTLFYNTNWATCWANAYNNYDAAEWIPGTYHKKNFLASSAGLLADTRYYAVIYTSRNVFVFKPSDYLTQEKWDNATTVNFRWNPTPYYGYSTEGGEYTLLETGEKKEQVFDWISFNVPKSLGSYDDFRVTLEGNARDIDDLKPAQPILNNPTSVGSYTWITDARLCVA